jgi:aromatic ring-opening dioxygenase catalytic subunit (LigB family)
MTSARMPTVFVPHGGGPWPWMPGMTEAMAPLREYLSGLVPRRPRPTAIVMISAHWEAPVPTVMSAAQPPMLYDYSGFPASTYEVQWPAPGDPELAARVRERLERAGMSSAADPRRGFDHGTFVVTGVALPDADVPTLQVSLIRGLDPAAHLELGRALAPLRDEGVLIVGSGMSYHNLPMFQTAMMGRGGTTMSDDSRAFHDWLIDGMAAEPSTRASRLVEWELAPKARACHPREEHLLPLMVVAGAAGDDPADVAFRSDVLGAQTCAIEFRSA